jgi:DNA-binding response OmpR family regulator
MSANTKRVLIVDDSPEDLQMLFENLKHDYAVLAATSGSRALDIAAKDEHTPDVILMDVTMPIMDGYETCRRLKASNSTRGIDVIFVSAHDTTEEKLAGYEAGGSDYVIKPFSPEELHQKIRLAINNRDLREGLEREKNAAFQTAMTAMVNGGELGVVLEFLRNSFAVASVDALAQHILEGLANFALSGSVQVRATSGAINMSTQGHAAPLEAELLTRLRHSGRILERGARLILNFGEVSLLVKDLPISDPDKCGRLRDHLALLAEGAASKLVALELQYKSTQRAQQYQGLLQFARLSLQDIDKEQREQKAATIKIMDDMLGSLERSFLAWGLSEQQEELLLSIVQTAIQASMQQFEAGRGIDKRLAKIIDDLEQLSGDS